MIGILQSIDMITSLYENSFPMRFGVILYSSNLIKQIEKSGGEINTSVDSNGLNEEDLSSLVIFPLASAILLEVLFSRLVKVGYYQLSAVCSPL